MVNPVRGETVLETPDGPLTLCLTLGALAEIEGALELASMADIAKALSTGSPRVLQIVLRALLRGGECVEAAEMIDDLSISPRGASNAIAECFRLALS